VSSDLLIGGPVLPPLNFDNRLFTSTPLFGGRSMWFSPSTLLDLDKVNFSMLSSWNLFTILNLETLGADGKFNHRGELLNHV